MKYGKLHNGLDKSLNSDSISDIQKNSSIVTYCTTIISELNNDSKFDTHGSIQSMAVRNWDRMKNKLYLQQGTKTKQYKIIQIGRTKVWLPLWFCWVQYSRRHHCQTSNNLQKSIKQQNTSPIKIKSQSYLEKIIVILANSKFFNSGLRENCWSVPEAEYNTAKTIL